jgi:hypothetical protein
MAHASDDEMGLEGIGFERLAIVFHVLFNSLSKIIPGCFVHNLHRKIAGLCVFSLDHNHNLRLSLSLPSLSIPPSPASRFWPFLVIVIAPPPASLPGMGSDYCLIKFDVAGQ